MKKLMDYLLHVVELARELARPGELAEWHRIDPRDERRRLTLPIPRDTGCYPYHHRLDEAQLVSEDDFT